MSSAADLLLGKIRAKARHPGRRPVPAERPVRRFATSRQSLTRWKSVMKNRVLPRMQNVNAISLGGEFAYQVEKLPAALEHLRWDCRCHQDDSSDERHRSGAEQKERLEDDATSERMSDEVDALEVRHLPEQVDEIPCGFDAR